MALDTWITDYSLKIPYGGDITSLIKNPETLDGQFDVQMSQNNVHAKFVADRKNSLKWKIVYLDTPENASERRSIIERFKNEIDDYLIERIKEKVEDESF